LADQFIGVKPGSDLYVALAMCNTIISNGWHDLDYLKESTIATYLVDTSNGQLLKEENGYYLNWDLATGEATPIAPGKGDIYASKPAFKGEFSVNGTKARPVFDLLQEHLAKYTIADAARIAGVPESVLLQFTKDYVEAESAYILGALGIRYQNQNEFYRAINLLGALTGRINGKLNSGVTGGLLNSGYAILFNDAAISRPLGPEENKMKFVRQKDFFEQVETGSPYPIKAFIKASGNPVHNCPNYGRWQNAFNKMDLVVDIDIWMTDTGELADYVLPDCMPFERYEILCYATYNHVVLQEPAIEPQGEARDATFFYSELAKRVGLGNYFDKTAEDWLAVRLETDYPLLAEITPKLTYERLKQEKIVRTVAPSDPPFDPWKAVGFLTNSGRMDIYAERLADIGHGFPTWQEPLETPMTFDANAKYPYQFFTGRQRFFMQSMFTDDPLMIKMSGAEPTARMNPLDAKREGIKDGDKVEVYNQRGKVVAILRIEEAVPPGTVHVWFGWRRRQFEAGTYSELLVPLGDQTTINDTAEHWFKDTIEEQAPEDMVFGSLSGYAGGVDTIWDCACAVKKNRC
jgi:molybdopterin-containing oxidoreductase family molybdopterin binding subunit